MAHRMGFRAWRHRPRPAGMPWSQAVTTTPLADIRALVARWRSAGVLVPLRTAWITPRAWVLIQRTRIVLRDGIRVDPVTGRPWYVYGYYQRRRHP